MSKDLSKSRSDFVFFFLAMRETDPSSVENIIYRRKWAERKRDARLSIVEVDR